jgi:hypothetical protein
VSHYERLHSQYAEQPGEVSLETQALCNARCTFCPYPTLERQGTLLPDALIDRLIDEMSEFPHPFYFSPFKVNEPFLDKRLLPICRAFNEKVPRGTLRLFSNGSPLTDKNLDGVAALKNVAHLWISLNSHRPKEYAELMGLDFEQTARRLDNLHEKDFPHPVMVSRVGSDPDFGLYVNWRWPKFRVAFIKRDAWIDYTHADNDEVPNTPCARWWELNISATGKAALCCMDGEAKYGFGDIRKQSLLEIYNHPALKRWRDGFMSRKDAGHPCFRCTY